MAKIFKAVAQGDTVYIQADDQMHAAGILFEKFGPIPRGMVEWSEVDRLPDGEGFL